MEDLILVGIGGALGSMIRFEVSRIRPVRGIPAGTAIVNITGSLLFSLVLFARPSGDLYSLVDTGLLGGFTTFSTFSYETFRMLEEGEFRAMLTHIAVNLGGSLLGAGGAWMITAIGIGAG